MGTQQLTLSSLRCPNNISGYKYVVRCGGGHGWQASRNGGGRPDGWRGPMRRTPLEAAQDYIAHANYGYMPSGRPLNLQRTIKAPRPATPKRTASEREKVLLAQLREERKNNPVVKLHEPVTYLVGETGNDTAVKVGHADYNVYSRLDSLQTGNPRTLVLLATLPGGAAVERELHERYEAHNVLNEWFEPTPELLSEFDVTEHAFAVALGIHERIIA